MNTEEAEQILKEELDYFNEMPYAELRDRIGENSSSERTTTSGRSYQLEVLIVWDSKSQDAIRITVSIDDGGWRAFFPLTESIFKLPSE